MTASRPQCAPLSGQQPDLAETQFKPRASFVQFLTKPRLSKKKGCACPSPALDMEESYGDVENLEFVHVTDRKCYCLTKENGQFVLHHSWKNSKKRQRDIEPNDQMVLLAKIVQKFILGLILSGRQLLSVMDLSTTFTTKNAFMNVKDRHNQ
uniref:Uncharacterized protein n=1 Tax=Romanomermis culicivorax TaxID=13658 RepID=A0A915JLP0_ROMCU